jgi:ribosomal-protein-alanine N-acetyltransferase
MSAEFMHASLEGNLARATELIGAVLPSAWPDRAARPMRYRLEQIEIDPAVQPWLIRAMVLREPVRSVVGHIGFHAAPDRRGAVEVGYTVDAAFRRRGYAFEAVQALFAWATREHGIHLFVASVSPDNAASLSLVHKLGFSQVATQCDDEDGEELVFELSR